MAQPGREGHTALVRSGKGASPTGGASFERGGRACRRRLVSGATRGHFRSEGAPMSRCVQCASPFRAPTPCAACPRCRRAAAVARGPPLQARAAAAEAVRRGDALQHLCPLPNLGRVWIALARRRAADRPCVINCLRWRTIRSRAAACLAPAVLHRPSACRRHLLFRSSRTCGRLGQSHRNEHSAPEKCHARPQS